MISDIDRFLIFCQMVEAGESVFDFNKSSLYIGKDFLYFTYMNAAKQ